MRGAPLSFPLFRNCGISISVMNEKESCADNNKKSGYPSGTQETQDTTTNSTNDNSSNARTPDTIYRSRIS